MSDECYCIMTTTNIKNLKDLDRCVMVSSLSFKQTLSLFNAFKVRSFKCPDCQPKVTMVDNGNDGYVLVVKKSPDKKCCDGCCAREFAKEEKLRVTEDERYVTLQPERNGVLEV